MIYTYATSVYGVPGGSCYCCRAPTGVVCIHMYVCMYMRAYIHMLLVSMVYQEGAAIAAAPPQVHAFIYI